MQMPASAPGWKVETRYSPAVLIGNWQEDRLRDEKKYFKPATTYSVDFRNYPGASPDVLVRRNAELNNSGLSSDILFGHGSQQQRKELITWYDEDYNHRAREGCNKLPALRNWSSSTMTWIPEKSDYPIQGDPTNYGLCESRQKKWADETNELQSGLTARINTTYRTSYLPWPRSIYLATDRRVSRSAPLATERLNAAAFCTSRRVCDKPRMVSASLANSRLVETGSAHAQGQRTQTTCIAPPATMNTMGRSATIAAI